MSNPNFTFPIRYVATNSQKQIKIERFGICGFLTSIVIIHLDDFLVEYDELDESWTIENQVLEFCEKYSTKEISSKIMSDFIWESNFTNIAQETFTRWSNYRRDF